MTRHLFGALPDGSPVEEFTLRAGAIEARIITWGAVLRDLVVRDRAGRPRQVVLGLNTIEDYLVHSRNFGAICGRVVNRIAGARMTIDGVSCTLTPNFRGRHTLHGGASGFSRRVWSVAAADEASVTLDLHSPHGEEGFPGAVRARCIWRVEPPAVLRVVLTATTDAPTAVNLAPHAYFNLDGAATIDAHLLEVAADFYTPTDPDGIPTGEIRTVAATPFDFRGGRRLGDAPRPEGGYDVNLVLRRAGAAPGLLPVATLGSADGALAMEVRTTEPGLQLYDATGLDLPVIGVDGRRYGPRAGLAIEPQHFPDAVHHAHFPSVILRPGETRRQETAFVFS
ncbi:aldose epimerase family protein [Elioraea sp.]|uniref:aldose epimerase family protein n=1 Tax=Elioraea sp. TaxID=2185103 RepID=UPI0021DE68F4|nr:aldose epimerase family protein [Elioraea sp.]GIX11703.1 MAG: aldose 1-epimerase [Elioraea sp.]